MGMTSINKSSVPTTAAGRIRSVASSSSSTSRHGPSNRRESRRPPWPTDRRTSAINNNNQAPPTVTEEEIYQLKRYEDFTTIDWVQDSLHEQSRRRARRREGTTGFWDQEGTFGWRRQVREAYDAGQSWLVVTIVGAAIGLNSAFLNIVTEWLSDVKLGHCTTAFYLNKQFCCWGSEEGMYLFSCLCVWL